jgi:hypothetical protein
VVRSKLLAADDSSTGNYFVGLGPTSSTKFPSGSRTIVKAIEGSRFAGNAIGPFAIGLTFAFANLAIAASVLLTMIVM